MIGTQALSLAESQKVLQDASIPETDPRKPAARAVIAKEAARLSEMAAAMQDMAAPAPAPAPVLASAPASAPAGDTTPQYVGVCNLIRG